MSEPSFAQLPLGRTRLWLEGPVKGPPVVLVHGLSYPVEVWTELSRALMERGHRVLCVELPGRGQSTFEGGSLSLESLADHVAQAIAYSQLVAPATLVSLSNSDWLVAMLAVTSPSRVRSLVWVAPAGLDARTHDARLPQGLWGQKWVGVWLRRKLLRRMKEHQRRSAENATPSAAIAYAAAMESVRSNPHFGLAVCRQLAQGPPSAALEQLCRRLAALGLPLLMLRFADEKDATREGIGFLLERLPACQIRDLSGTHMALIENPEPVNAAIAQWLAEVR